MIETLKVQRGTHGLGLFATTPIAKDSKIIEYTGEVITADEANRRGGQYLFELNDNWTIDGKGGRYRSLHQSFVSAKLLR